MRLQGRPVILIGNGPAADAKAHLLGRAGAEIVRDAAAVAALAIVADGDEQAAAALRRRGVLVNVVDRPDLCDFTLPAIVDRDPVLVAIGTGGVSAGLAAALRQRLETILPAGLGRLAEALAAARGLLRQRFPDGDARRRTIGALLAAGGPLDPLMEQHDPREIIASAETPAPVLERIDIHSADPDLLTVRAVRLLGLADRLYVEGDVPAAILDRSRADAVRLQGAPPSDEHLGLTLHLRWIPE